MSGSVAAVAFTNDNYTISVCSKPFIFLVFLAVTAAHSFPRCPFDYGSGSAALFN